MSAISYTREAINRLNTQRKSLPLPIVAFTQDITNAAGQFAMLTSALGISRLYQEQHAPLNCLEKNNRRSMTEGFHTSNMLVKKYGHACPSINQYFEFSKSTHSIHYYEKAEDKIDYLYTFSFSCSDEVFEDILLNEKDLIVDYINQHKTVNENIIKAALEPSHSMKLHIEPNSESNLRNKIYINVKKQVPLKLTKQQRVCVDYLFEGLSTKQIAQELNLSFRTVQHHLDAVRYNNDFCSLKELLCFVKTMAC